MTLSVLTTTHSPLHKWPLPSTLFTNTPYQDSSQPASPQISTCSSGGTDFAVLSCNNSTSKLKMMKNPTTLKKTSNPPSRPALP